MAKEACKQGTNITVLYEGKCKGTLQLHDFENSSLNNIKIFLTLTRDIKYFKYFNGEKKWLSFNAQ